MNLTVNGVEKNLVSEGSTIQQLIEVLQLSHKKVVIEVNGQILVKDQHDGKVLKDGDVIEIVHFVGGG